MSRNQFAGIPDFSRESDFQQRLLNRIKRECFAELSDDDLDFVNAAGVPMPPANGDLSAIKTEEFGAQ